MITADYHAHTSFSYDSEAPMAQMIEQAISLGFTRICFTDHMDYGFPPLKETAPDGTVSEKTIFFLDVPAYSRALAELAHKYRSQIQVGFGIEMGLTDRSYDFYRSLLADYPFDFNIASSHLVDFIDPYYPEFWQRYPDYRDAIRRYFHSILEHITVFSDFDTYGHLDYVFRYVPQETGVDSTSLRSYSYAEYADILDAILLRLLELDKALEVNTGGYSYGLGVPNPQPEVLRRYRELGGEKITIGSDAHTPEQLGFSFARARELLLALGYRYYTVYEQHRPIMCRL